jgi:nucleoid DNA-binding protein
MVELVARYLSFQKQVSIKDVGTFSVEELPARLDFPNKLLHAPEHILHFNTKWSNDELFEQWAQKQLGLSQQEIKAQLQNLSADFQRTLSDKNELTWEGIGRFSKNDQQLILFTNGFEAVKRPPVVAEKVIRKNAQHSIRVGEQEKTNIEMEELLQAQSRKTLNLWWLFALALFLTAFLAILFIANYEPKQWNRQGNSEKPTLEEMPVLHKIQ